MIESLGFLQHVRDLRVSLDNDTYAEEVNENQSWKALKAVGLTDEMIGLLVNRERLALTKISAANEYDAQIIGRKIFALNEQLTDMANNVSLGDGIKFDLNIFPMRLKREK